MHRLLLHLTRSQNSVESVISKYWVQATDFPTAAVTMHLTWTKRLLPNDARRSNQTEKTSVLSLTFRAFSPNDKQLSRGPEDPVVFCPTWLMDGISDSGFNLLTETKPDRKGNFHVQW